MIWYVNHSFWAAIDIGGTYSGYSFVPRRNPVQIIPRVWKGQGLVSPSTKTCILMDENKQLTEFGYSAEDEYSSYNKDESKDWFYFNGLKRDLYTQKVI